MPLNLQGKKEIIVLGRVVDPDYHGEIGLLLHKEGKRDYVWSAGDALENLLLLLCTEIKVNEKLQQSNPSRMKRHRHFLDEDMVHSRKRSKTC